MRGVAVAAAAAGAAAGGLAVYASHRLGWWGARRGPKLDWGAGGVSKPAAAAANGGAAPALTAASLDADPVVAEQLTRNIQFLGAAGQGALAGALVVVVGLGGVGSHAAAHLLRAGVGRLRLIDFDQVGRVVGGKGGRRRGWVEGRDGGAGGWREGRAAAPARTRRARGPTPTLSTPQVTLSSLNRHATATRADVGTPKAVALAAAFKQVMPEAAVDARVAMFSADTADALLAGAPSYVIDAIDNIHTKVLLLKECQKRSLPVVSAGGAGGKADPTRARVLSLDSTPARADALARSVRQRLRRQGGDPAAVAAVVSDEAPRVGLVDPSIAPGASAEDYRVVPGFRLRTLPVLGPTPAAFGGAAAAWVIGEVSGAPLAPAPPPPRPPESCRILLDRLADREERLHGAPLSVDLDDVAWLAREVWRGTSAAAAAAPPRLPASDAALAASTAGLTLTRFNPAAPASVDNLVLLSFAEADAHDGGAAVRGADGWAARAAAVLARVAAETGGADGFGRGATLV